MDDSILLQKFPFESTEELLEWVEKYLPKKIAKLSELIDFFTIINGETQVAYTEKDSKEGPFEVKTVVFELYYAAVRIKLHKEIRKKETFKVDKVEVLQYGKSE